MPRTDFHVDVDGFSFDNSYTYTDAEKQQVIDTIKNQKGVVLALFPVITTADLLASAFSLGLIPPGALDTAAAAALAGAFDTLIKNAFPGKQEGFCGGMAFAAMDYFSAKWLSDRGFPNRGGDSLPNTPGAGGTLRAFIWQRHLDSLTSGCAAGTLQAILQVHYLNGGAKGLLGNAKSEWTKLKGHLDGGSPWPICLVAASADPTQSHQVVAIGYDETDANHVALHVYDVDVPYGSDATETGTLKLDFSGSALSIAWTDSANGVNTGSLVHFFCASYSPKTPPVAVGVSQSVTGAGALRAGAQFTVAYQAQNVGFGPSVAFVPAMEVDRPAQFSHAGVTPVPLPRPIVKDPDDPKPIVPLPTSPTPIPDVPPSVRFVVQTDSKPAPLASAYVAAGTKTGAGATVSASMSTALIEGRVYYYPQAQIVCADGSTIFRSLPGATSSVAAQASSDVPFPAAPVPAKTPTKPAPGPPAR